MVRRQSASMEDYLEAIHVLDQQENPVTVTAISQALDVKKPSVTSALKRLSEQGLVRHPRYGEVELTGEGQILASDILHRHRTLREFLVEILCIDPSTGETDACQMEHTLSPASQKQLSRFVEFVLHKEDKKPVWLQEFQSQNSQKK